MRRKRVGSYELRQLLGPLGPARRVLGARGHEDSALLLVQRRRAGATAAEDAWRRYAESPPPAHPGLLPVVGFERDDVHFALATEARDCRPLGSWFVDEQPGLAHCLTVFARLVDAVAALHREGLTHGALRPDTILIDVRDQPLLVGAGGLTAGPTGRTRHVSLEAVYQAPELIEAPVPVSPTSDVYALGCLLYFFGVGAHPWGAGQSARSLLRKKKEASFDPPLVTSRVPSRELVRVVARCTASAAADRPQGAADVIEALRTTGLWKTDVEQTFDEFSDFYETGSAPALPVSHAELEVVSLDDVEPIDPSIEAAVVLLRAAPGLGASPHWPDALRRRLLGRLAQELGDLDRHPVVTDSALAREGADRLPVLAAALRRLEGAVTLRTLLQGLGEPERLALLACLLWLQAEEALDLCAPADDFWDEAW
jgi:hypothetical protein